MLLDSRQVEPLGKVKVVRRHDVHSGLMGGAGKRDLHFPVVLYRQLIEHQRRYQTVHPLRHQLRHLHKSMLSGDLVPSGRDSIQTPTDPFQGHLAQLRL